MFYIHFYVQIVGLTIKILVSARNMCFFSSTLALFLLMYKELARGLPLEKFTGRELVNGP